MKTSFDKFMASNAVQEVSNVELASVKVDLALGDNLIKKANEIYALAKKVEEGLDNAFVPVREIERAINGLSNNPIGSEFQDFIKKLQALEGEYQSEKAKAQAMAKELGVPLPKISWIDEVNGVLSYAQRSEETARKDINLYNAIYKEAKALNSKLR
jgi:hypothetical protein